MSAVATMMDQMRSLAGDRAALVFVTLVVAGFVAVYFEDGFTEALSFAFLIVLSVICRRIFEARRDDEVYWWRHISRIWLLISLGFLFLAIDEAFSVHERLDTMLHRYLLGRESALSDRIDDLIVLCYGVIGIAIIFLHMREMRFFRASLNYIWAGLAFMAIMVLFDAVTNRDDVLRILFVDADNREFARNAGVLAEEFAKLIAEVLLVIGFLDILRQATGSARHGQF
jgi:hypothetical protein